MIEKQYGSIKLKALVDRINSAKKKGTLSTSGPILLHRALEWKMETNGNVASLIFSEKDSLNASKNEKCGIVSFKGDLESVNKFCIIFALNDIL